MTKLRLKTSGNALTVPERPDTGAPPGHLRPAVQPCSRPALHPGSRKSRGGGGGNMVSSSCKLKLLLFPKNCTFMEHIRGLLLFQME